MFGTIIVQPFTNNIISFQKTKPQNDIHNQATKAMSNYDAIREKVLASSEGKVMEKHTPATGAETKPKVSIGLN